MKASIALLTVMIVCFATAESFSAGLFPTEAISPTQPLKTITPTPSATSPALQDAFTRQISLPVDLGFKNRLVYLNTSIQIQENAEIQLTELSLVTITCTIENTGTSPAANVRLGLYSNGVRKSVYDRTIPVISARSSAPVQISFQFGYSDEQIELRIDPENTLQEGSESNNSFKYTFKKTVAATSYNLFTCIQTYNGFLLKEGMTVPAGRTYDLSTIFGVQGTGTHKAEAILTLDGTQVDMIHNEAVSNQNFQKPLPLVFSPGWHTMMYQARAIDNEPEKTLTDNLWSVRFYADPAYQFPCDLCFYGYYLNGVDLSPWQTNPLVKISSGGTYTLDANIMNGNQGSVFNVPYRVTLNGSTVMQGTIPVVPGFSTHQYGRIYGPITIQNPTADAQTLKIELDPGNQTPDTNKTNNVGVGVFHFTN